MSDRIQTYCILDPPYAKIGKSVCPRKRLPSIQTGNPRELTLHGVIDGDKEADIHSEFRHLHVRGEWFQADKELLDRFTRDEDPSPLVVVCLDSAAVHTEPYEDYVVQSFKCPRCPPPDPIHGGVSIEAAYFDFDYRPPYGSGRFREPARKEEKLRLLCSGRSCGHTFEVSIDRADGQIESIQLVDGLKPAGEADAVCATKEELAELAVYAD